MSYAAFSESWARAWADELRASDAYARAAATWEGSLVLEMTAGDGEDEGPGAAVFVDLWHGECRGARSATGGDLGGTDFLIRGGVETWQRVLAGDLEPIFGIMSGKLRLVRGNLAKLVPQITAARELVAAAARIETVFPGAQLPRSACEP